MDPLAIAEAHHAAIIALEKIGDMKHAEVLRVQGVECLRLARMGAKNQRHIATEPIVRKNREHG